MREGMKYIYCTVAIFLVAGLLLAASIVLSGTLSDTVYIISNIVFSFSVICLLYYGWKYVIPMERKLKKKKIEEKVDEFVKDRVGEDKKIR